MMNIWVLTAIFALNNDWLKLLLIVLVGLGLLAVARWSSRVSGSAQNLPANLATPDTSETLTAHVPPVPHGWGWQAENLAAFFPYDPSLGNLRITKFFFEKSNAVLVAENPRVFADELHLELYDPDSEHKWWQSYFVATPEGLAQVLRSRSWRFLYAPQILVFPQYDWEEIRRAIVSRIKIDHDFFDKSEDREEESL